MTIVEQGKALLRSRTVWLAVIQGLAGVFVAIASVDPSLKTGGIVLVLKSIIDILVRVETTEPIKKLV